MKRLFLAVALLSPATFVSCGNATVQTPAPVQSADLRLARAFDDAQAALNQARGMVAAHPAMKEPLNKIIASYNAAQDAYLVFHNSVKQGGTPDPATLDAQIAQITADIAALVRLFQ